MILRPYQLQAREMLYSWLCENSGNPCIVLPTGAGKSVCIADLCKYTVENYPSIRILILTHSKELIEQNAEKLFKLWPYAPAGVYSSGLGMKDLTQQITFAGIQSIWRKGIEFGQCDIIIVDEAHAISHKEEGTYRKFLDDVKSNNPALVIVGYTATPYRLGHGLITDKPAIFDAIIEPATILELISGGFLSPLKSKFTETKLSTAGVGKRGGEYIESELQKAVDKTDLNESIIEQVISRAEGREHWLFFCAGVDHAEHMKEALLKKGIKAACVTGKTSKADRTNILSDFKSGKIKAVTNANILTTGFDYPDIDLIALCRPTMSAGLYMQMVGRGMRLKSHTDHCLVLDFAGVVQTHGPIVAVNPPKKKGEGEGVAPSKECPECFEIIAAQNKICPECGYIFPVEKKEMYLRNDDIMGQDPITVSVDSWVVDGEYVGKSSGKKMMKIKYYPPIGQPVEEYLCIYHQGYAGQKALFTYNDIFNKSIGLQVPPSEITYVLDGKFKKIIKRKWVDNAPTNEEMII